MGWLVIPVLLIVLFALGIKLVRPVEEGIIEFLGKYSKTASAGFNWIIPGLRYCQKLWMTTSEVASTGRLTTESERKSGRMRVWPLGNLTPA